MRPGAVRAWLRGLDPADGPGRAQHPADRRLAWEAALGAITDAALDEALRPPGPGWASVGFACPSTVPTAPLEWCAVALARGAEVVLKAPVEDPGPATWLAQTAQAAGLPLTATTDRGALLGPALAVVMGADETVAAVRAARGGRPVLGFGHRFSVAWVADPAAVDGAALSRDLVLHEGRGCLSPVAWFTPRPALLADRVFDEVLARRTPCLTPAEGAGRRLRLARERIAGRVVHEGPGGAVTLHPGGPPAEAFPGWVAIVPAADPDAVWAAVDLPHLSTVGTDAPVAVPPGVRGVALGEMQRPPLVRLHDGVDWLAALAGGPLAGRP